MPIPARMCRSWLWRGEAVPRSALQIRCGLSPARSATWRCVRPRDTRKAASAFLRRFLDLLGGSPSQRWSGFLKTKGPQLGYPHSSAISSSQHGHMRELRIQHQGRPLRVLYAFDPRRTAILLLGGDKTGKGRWYEDFVPVADRLYDLHLAALKREGLI
jgi:hypothetical protein